MSILVTKGLGGQGLVTQGYGNVEQVAENNVVLFDPFKRIRRRGIQFANLLDKSPGTGFGDSATAGAADSPTRVVFGGAPGPVRTHLNTPMNIVMAPGDNAFRMGGGGTGPRERGNSGAGGGGGFGNSVGGGGPGGGSIKFRFRNYGRASVPASINIGGGGEVYPWTNQIPPDPVMPGSCSLSWSLGPLLPRWGSVITSFAKFSDGRIVYMDGSYTGSDGGPYRHGNVIAADGLSVVRGGISTDPTNSSSYFFGSLESLGNGPSAQVFRHGPSLSGAFYYNWVETFNPSTLQWTERPHPENWEFYTELGSNIDPIDGMTLTRMTIPSSSVGNVLKIGGIVNNGYIASGTVEYSWDSNTWFKRPSMSIGRASHTATRLSNGKILVAGGVVYPPYSNYIAKSCEIYDPDLQTWTPVASMNIQRHGHVATLLPNGKVLVVGGRASGSFPTFFYDAAESAEVYNPGSNTWTLTPVRSPLKRAGPNLVTLGDGYPYLVGGGDYGFGSYTDVEMYNWFNNTWVPKSPMSFSFSNMIAAPLSQCAMIVWGGDIGTTVITRSTQLSKILPHTIVAPQGHILDVDSEAIWRFDELSGSANLVDATGNGYTIQAFGSPLTASGQVGSARHVSVVGSPPFAAPTDKFFQGLGSASMGTTFSGSFTVEMWINPDSASPTDCELFIYNGLDFSIVNSDTIMAEMQHYGNTTGKIELHQWQNTGALVAMQSNRTLTNGSWHHVAFSRQDQGGNLHTFKIFIDGALDSTHTSIPGMDYSITGAGHFIGMGNYIGNTGFGNGVGNPFRGLMDDCRVSKVARSDAEIYESYARGIGIP